MIRTILFWIFLLLFLLMFLFLFQKSYKKHSITARSVAIDGIFAAIIFLLGFIPQLGYIQIFPGISLTLNHIPVLIGACLFGAKKGTLYGFLFGITSMIQGAINGTGLNVLFIYPWIALPPRILFGLFAGLFFSLRKRTSKIWGSTLFESIGAFFLTVLHTALVFGDLFLFYYEETLSFFISDSPIIQGVGFTFLGALLIGALGEAILAAMVVPATCGGVRKALGNRNE